MRSSDIVGPDDAAQVLAQLLRAAAVADGGRVGRGAERRALTAGAAVDFTSPQPAA